MTVVLAIPSAYPLSVRRHNGKDWVGLGFPFTHSLFPHFLHLAIPPFAFVGSFNYILMAFPSFVLWLPSWADPAEPWSHGPEPQPGQTPTPTGVVCAFWPGQKAVCGFANNMSAWLLFFSSISLAISVAFIGPAFIISSFPPSFLFYISQVSRRHTTTDVLQEAPIQATGPPHDSRRVDNCPVNHMSTLFGLVS